ncbi:MAG TPA: sulfite exporter TauE/SafE family protein [Alphaproteobacteria bacterium]
MPLELGVYVLVGFVAQLVDGALGMGFGLICTSVLLTTGVPPAIASASVHTAEIATTGVAGLSHLWHRNIDGVLFRWLAGAGIAGGVLGAYVLTELPEAIVRPLVTAYLVAMALLIFVRVWRGRRHEVSRKGVVPLGAAGGFLDAVGGGGWGPIVASTLIARGDSPRYSIGSVSAAEFFVTLSISAVFLLRLDLVYHWIVGGLVLGGAAAAPLAGYVSRRLPPRMLMALVGLTVLAISAVNLVRWLA